MAPTTEAFFCVPKPTTITSSFSVMSSCRATSTIPRLFTCSTLVLYPIILNSSDAFSFATTIVYVPFSSVVVALFVPASATVTPVSNSPFSVVTRPLTRVLPDCCAVILPVRSNSIARDKKSRVSFWQNRNLSCAIIVGFFFNKQFKRLSISLKIKSVLPERIHISLFV